MKNLKIASFHVYNPRQSICRLFPVLLHFVSPQVNGTRLLSLEGECTKYITSCRTT